MVYYRYGLLTRRLHSIKDVDFVISEYVLVQKMLTRGTYKEKPNSEKALLVIEGGDGSLLFWNNFVQVKDTYST